MFTEQKLAVAPDIEVQPIEDRDLIGRACFCRLRQFDPDWQKRHGFDDRIVGLDLDAIITGQLDPLFDRQESFLILKGANAVNPNPFNASVTMLRPGYHAGVWKTFSMDAAKMIRFHEFPDDQGWIWHRLPDATGWNVGRSSGIYGFEKPGWPRGSYSLPPGARIVAFIGRRKPSQYTGLPWVTRYWSALA